jgi:hypothetical protein
MLACHGWSSITNHHLSNIMHDYPSGKGFLGAKNTSGQTYNVGCIAEVMMKYLLKVGLENIDVQTH